MSLAILNTHKHAMHQINLLKVKQKKATVAQDTFMFLFYRFVFKDFITSLNQYSI